MTTVFNLNRFSTYDQPMFFGESLNVTRYDQVKYPLFEKSTVTQKSFFWNPEEINLSKDSADFKGLADHEKHIFLKNIAYQTLLDSVQERAPLIALLPSISLPELEGTVITWSFFEHIHAKSYQWILQNLFSSGEVTKVFDDIMEDKNIMDRAAAIIKYYDDFIQYDSLFRVLGPGTHEVNTNGVIHKYELDMYTRKKKLYLALAAVYALESIRFYVSFACSFAFGQRGKMTGNADIIKLIAKDENQHVAITLNIFRNWQRKEGDEDFLKIAKDCEAEFLAIFDEVVSQEKDWAKYLFSGGSIIGLNENLLCQYLEFIANKRLKSLGFKKRYENDVNPFTWINKWFDSDDEQVAPQEKEIVSYLIGNMEMTITEDKLIDF